jgi:hypothetical protein
MEQQGRTAVRAHQGERKEAGTLNQDRQAHCCRDSEQGTLQRGADKVEEIIEEIIKEIFEDIVDEIVEEGRVLPQELQEVVEEVQ